MNELIRLTGPTMKELRIDSIKVNSEEKLDSELFQGMMNHAPSLQKLRYSLKFRLGEYFQTEWIPHLS